MTGNEKFLKFFLKKLFFQDVLVFIDLFYRYYYLLYFIYSDCILRHVCTTWFSIIFTSSTEKKLFFSIMGFFCRLWFYEKKLERCFTFKLNLNITNFTMYFNKKTDLNFIIFETKKYVHRNGYLRSCWL